LKVFGGQALGWAAVHLGACILMYFTMLETSRGEKSKASWFDGRKSGAKDTRSPDASRVPGVFEPREASGVRAALAPLSGGGKEFFACPECENQAQRHSRLTCRKVIRWALALFRLRKAC